MTDASNNGNDASTSNAQNAQVQNQQQISTQHNNNSSNNNGKDDTMMITTNNNTNGNNNNSAEKDAEKEADNYQIQNPGRVVPKQVQFIEFAKNSRWSMVKKGEKAFGILLCRDNAPEEVVEYVREQAVVGGQANEGAVNGAEADGEVAAPEPFEYVPRDT
eukprot:TRINITY_DN2826_c0_g2_i2.p3 TRINITY_DN2826_c0_g2~~TRINITY_DN2826_c0_g2_i2.p3  ORF type:complete len:161 (-),score=46.98 TRINITY_DN2826_c0_g2_i2:166-648(-)